MSNSHSQQHPLRRAAGLTTRAFDPEDGAIVLDIKARDAHRLEPLAARIWDLCDGTRTIDAIAAGAGTSPEVVATTLDQLAELGLLEDDQAAGHTRRRVLIRTAQIGAVAAVSAPLIESLALPAAALAVSPPNNESYSTTIENNGINGTIGGTGATGETSATSGDAYYIYDSGTAAAPAFTIATTTSSTFYIDFRYTEGTGEAQGSLLIVNHTLNDISYVIGSGTENTIAPGKNATAAYTAANQTITINY